MTDFKREFAQACEPVSKLFDQMIACAGKFDGSFEEAEKAFWANADAPRFRPPDEAPAGLHATRINRFRKEAR